MYSFFDFPRTAIGLSRLAFTWQKYFMWFGDRRSIFQNVGSLNTFAQDIID